MESEWGMVQWHAGERSAFVERTVDGVRTRVTIANGVIAAGSKLLVPNHEGHEWNDVGVPADAALLLLAALGVTTKEPTP